MTCLARVALAKAAPVRNGYFSTIGGLRRSRRSAGLVLVYLTTGLAVHDFRDPVDSRAGSVANVALDARDLQHVVLGFFVGRHLRAVLVDRAQARVVRGQRELLVVVVAIEQLAQIDDAGADVFGRVERVDDAELLRRRRHQLHQPHCALRRDRPGIEGRLHLDDRPDQLRPDTVLTGVLPDQRLELRARTARPWASPTGTVMARGRAVLRAVRERQDAIRVAPRVDLRLGRPGQAGERRTARPLRLQICVSRSVTYRAQVIGTECATRPVRSSGRKDLG